jgi:serine protease AprX
LAALTVGALGLGAVAVDGAAAADPTGSAAGVPLTSGSMYNVVDQIGVRSLWTQGYTGRGVNVAIIDTGVAPVQALQGAAKVVAMVDLSGESNDPSTRYLDTYGHGTHMAGIIAGRDPGADPKTAAQHPEWFLGVAPDAGIVSVKVAGRNGAADVSQVIAGIDWVVQHASLLNIRVLNLSYGTNSTQPYTIDPLAYAVERAWKAGIVVVASVGNDGRNARALANPASDPYVIAVSAVQPKQNGGYEVPMWATSGDGIRNPDVAAPGASIVSLRAPGSNADVNYPSGYVNQYLFKGSGSSQAAAVVSGAVAVLLSARPTLNPDQVKHLVTSLADSAAVVPQNPQTSGRGLLRMGKTSVAQTWPLSNASGSLEASRGDAHVSINGVVLQGEVTILGTPWVGATWAGDRWTGGSWDGTAWTGATWAGATWAGATWAGATWAGATWAGATWAGATWAVGTWS